MTQLFPRPRYLAAGLALLALAVLMPTGWYDAMPRRPELPPLPFRGVDLLRLTIALEGLVVVWLATRRQGWQPISEKDLLTVPPPGDDLLEASRTTWALLALTALGLVLRLIAINADLWLDEITPILDYGPLPVVQVIGSYLRSNNHLLNTLLVKGTVALFDQNEWAVRLPALMFGVAAIPAVYFVARLALSRQASLGAALLLAVSYHHIFFSQNARGYTAYLFFALTASGLFVRGLATDRLSVWVWYVVTLFLGFASLLNTAFVGAAHGVVGVIALVVVQRRGGSPAPLLRRLAWVFAIAAFLGLQLYATALPEILVVIGAVYAGAATGFAPNAGFLSEMARGISAGFGPGAFVAAIPFLAIAAAGYVSLFLRHWPLTLALTLPGVLTAVFLLVRGLTFSPRFFLLWLVLAIMAAAQGVWLAAQRAGRLVRPTEPGQDATRTGARIGAAGLVLLAAVSLLALPRYYRTPKQAYRAALQHVDSLRAPGDEVAVIYTAEKGVRYYLRRTGRDERSFAFVRSRVSFDSLRAAAVDRRIIVLTTFRRALGISLPDLQAEIEKGWAPERIFPGTVGDGAIAIWLPKRTQASRTEDASGPATSVTRSPGAPATPTAATPGRGAVESPAPDARR